MKKIVLIGAGGVIFSQNFIKDLLLDEELSKSQLVLMDINPERLKNSVIIAGMIARKLNVEFHPEATTDLRKALTGADYVITVFRSGTIEHQEIEYKIPKKYGVDQVVSDSMCPGGIFRGLRTLKALFEILDLMEEVCPGAYLLNYVNPMSMNTIALNHRAKTVRVIGLCHSVRNTQKQLCAYLDVPPEKVHYLAAGVNHQAFMLKFEMDGQSLYPRIRALLDNPKVYKNDKIRFELLRNFGFFPTESSGHGSEYVPFFRKRQDLIDKFCCCDYPAEDDGVNWNGVLAGCSGASLPVCRGMQKRNERDIAAYLSGEKELNVQHSNEYAMEIIASIEKNTTISANLNVMNRGLIPTLPPECSVEVPCLINGAGIIPCRIDDYPEQLAALNRGMINAQILAADGALRVDREKIYQAISVDPLTAAVCSLDEVRAMTDELFEALKDQIDQGFFA